MTLEIQHLSWDRNTGVAGLNRDTEVLRGVVYHT